MRIAMVAAISLVVAFGVQAQTTETTVTGFVTDTYCGRRGANDKHAEHARRSVASGVAQYALYDEASKKLYILAPQLEGHPIQKSLEITDCESVCGVALQERINKCSTGPSNDQSIAITRCLAEKNLCLNGL